MDLYHVMVRQKEEKVVIDDDAVIASHETYKLSNSPPKSFKLLTWNTAASTDSLPK